MKVKLDYEKLVEIIERFVAEAVSEERERCAKVAEQMPNNGWHHSISYARGGQDAAKRIRDGVEPT